MRQEYSGTGSIYKSYVIDDGWKIPENVIEVIDLRIETARNEALKRVQRQKREHRGSWLTDAVARKYADVSWVFNRINGNQYTGEVRRLGEELQDLYGVTEIEAVNILKGFHIKDYVNKYDRIRRGIPDYVDSQYICDNVLEEYGYIDSELYYYM